MAALPAPAEDDLGPLSGTPHAVVDAALEYAGVCESDVLYDVGCNDGTRTRTGAACFSLPWR